MQLYSENAQLRREVEKLKRLVRQEKNMVISCLSPVVRHTNESTRVSSSFFDLDPSDTTLVLSPCSTAVSSGEIRLVHMLVEDTTFADCAPDESVQSSANTSVEDMSVDKTESEVLSDHIA